MPTTIFFRRSPSLGSLYLLLLGAAGWGGYQFGCLQIAYKTPDSISAAMLVAEPAPEAKDFTPEPEIDLLALAKYLGRLEAQLFQLQSLAEKWVVLAEGDLAEVQFGTLPTLSALFQEAQETQDHSPTEDPTAVAPVVLASTVHSIKMPTSERLLGRLRECERYLAQYAQILKLLQQQWYHRNSLHNLSFGEKGKTVVDGPISSFFGKRKDPFTGREAWHQGVDFVAALGTPVKALAGGLVSFAASKGGYGNMVQIEHAHGLATRYGHNQALLVQVGQWVKKGQPIALAGSTGRSTGSHVHLEVHEQGIPVDPALYFADLKKS